MTDEAEKVSPERMLLRSKAIIKELQEACNAATARAAHHAADAAEFEALAAARGTEIAVLKDQIYALKDQVVELEGGDECAE